MSPPRIRQVIQPASWPSPSSQAEQRDPEIAGRRFGSNLLDVENRFPGLASTRAARESLKANYIEGAATPLDVHRKYTSQLNRFGITAREAVELLEEMEFMDRACEGAAPLRWMYADVIAKSSREGDPFSLNKAISLALDRGVLPEWVRDVDPGLLSMSKDRSNFLVTLGYLDGKAPLWRATEFNLLSDRANWEGALVSFESLKWLQHQGHKVDIPIKFYNSLIQICEEAHQPEAARLALQDLANRGLIPDQAVQDRTVSWQNSNLLAVSQYVKGDMEAGSLLPISGSILMKPGNQTVDVAKCLLSNLVWAKSKRPGLKLEIDLYRMAIDICLKDGDADSALAFRDHMIAQGVKSDEKLDSFVIHTCAKAAHQQAIACADGENDPTRAGEYANAALGLAEGTTHPSARAKRYAIWACMHAATAFKESGHVDRTSMAAKYADHAMLLLPQDSSDVEPDMIVDALMACENAAAAGSEEHIQKAISFYNNACDAGLPVNCDSLSTVVSILVHADRLQEAATLVDEGIGRGLCTPALGREKISLYGKQENCIDLHFPSIFTSKNLPESELVDRGGVSAKVAKAVLELHFLCGRLKPGPDSYVLSFGTGKLILRESVIEWLDSHGFTPIDFERPGGLVKSNYLRFERAEQ